MQNNHLHKINEIVSFIKHKMGNTFDVGMILGSGLGGFVNELSDKIVIPYSDIPNLPKSTAPGHEGNLVYGKLKGKHLLVMQGRFHIYEGMSPDDATLLIRAMKLLGINTLIINCACGSLNLQVKAGEIALITDHINFSGINPLVGENLDTFGPRFPGMFDIYTPKLQDIAHKAATNASIKLNSAVYAAILGPSYATRHELSMYINHHCGVIGMSLVQEAIVAAHSGMDILALAAVTDMALPYGHSHATHEEVVAVGRKISTQLQVLLHNILEMI